MRLVDHRLDDVVLDEAFDLGALLHQSVVAGVALRFYHACHFSLNVLASPAAKSLLLKLRLLLLSHLFLCVFQ